MKATCKDCYHCRACHEMYLLAVAQEDDFFERHDAETCEDFKNKADYAEVKHGEWIKLDGEWREQSTNKPLIIHQCSFCGTFYQNAPYNYCPHCGAKMDGRRDT